MSGTSGLVLGTAASGINGWTGQTQGRGSLIDFTGLITKGVLDWVNVKNYGATGNGVTDDTLSIQNALAAGGVGSVVYFPPGTYNVATSAPGASVFILQNQQSVIGAGQGATVIKMTNPAGFDWVFGNGSYSQVNPYVGASYFPTTTTLKLNYPESPTYTIYNSTVTPTYLTRGNYMANFTLDGGSLTAGACAGIVFNGAAYSLVENVTVQNLRLTPGGQGIIFSNCFLSNMAKCTFINVGQGPTILRCSFGCQVSDCNVFNSFDASFACVGTVYSNAGTPVFCSFVNCTASDQLGTSTAYGFDVGGPIYCQFVNCKSKNNGTSAGFGMNIHENLESTPAHIQVTNFEAYSCAGGAIQINGFGHQINGLKSVGNGSLTGYGILLSSYLSTDSVRSVPVRDVTISNFQIIDPAAAYGGIVMVNNAGYAGAIQNNILFENGIIADYQSTSVLTTALLIAAAAGVISNVQMRGVAKTVTGGVATPYSIASGAVTGIFRISQCPGMTPAGTVTFTPGTSGTVIPNNGPYDLTVYQSGGTVTNTQVGPIASTVFAGLTSGAFRVPVGNGLAWTGTVAPSWVAVTE